VFYLYMEQFTRRFARRSSAVESPPATEPLAAGSSS
jgi:hypothetical protein